MPFFSPLELYYQKVVLNFILNSISKKRCGKLCFLLMYISPCIISQHLSPSSQSEIVTICPFQTFGEPCFRLSIIETILKRGKGILAIIPCLNLVSIFCFNSEAFLINMDMSYYALACAVS